MASDKIVSGRISCTQYGENSPAEDFAESIAEFFRDAKVFERDFPNRAKILRTII